MDSRGLSLTEWVVLALVAEGPTHGFAVSRLTADTGGVGTMWQVPRPRVYRALDRLAGLSLIEASGTEPGRGGPPRTLFAVTASGRPAVDAWLMRPVRHIRDIRTEFLVKLALLDRAGRDSRPLLEAQAELIEPIIAGLCVQRDRARGFDHMVASWRYDTAEAALRLIRAAGRWAEPAGPREATPPVPSGRPARVRSEVSGGFAGDIGRGAAGLEPGPEVA